MKGLGQVLKSFRDRSVDFSVYDRNSGWDDYLKTLGPLEIPKQGSRAGLHVDFTGTTARQTRHGHNLHVPAPAAALPNGESR